jgi:hypothetical protein
LWLFDPALEARAKLESPAATGTEHLQLVPGEVRVFAAGLLVR